LGTDGVIGSILVNFPFAFSPKMIVLLVPSVTAAMLLVRL